MIKKLLGLFAFKTVFREDPFFRVSVDQNADSGKVKVTVELLGSDREYCGKFSIEESSEYPIEVRIPDKYSKNGNFYILRQTLTRDCPAVIEFSASPIKTGFGKVNFWFEIKVGLGGSISVIPAIFGLGDPAALEKSRRYRDVLYNKWIDENLEKNESAKP
ncbi:MAG: hypothetical protein ACR2QR_00865 [Woeseiaceae bacterium]